MKKSFVVILVIIISLVLIFFNFYTIIITETGLQNKHPLIVRKVYNPNRVVNILLPKAEKIIGLGDLIIHKDPVYTDKSWNKRDNNANRVYGLPGNVVNIEEKKVYNNQQLITVEDAEINFKYRVSFKQECDCKETLKSYDFVYLETIAGGRACDIITSPLESAEIAKEEQVSNVREHKVIRGTETQGFFPGHMFYSWNRDFMGDLFVPQKSVTVMLNPRNIALYDRIINIYENHSLIYNLNSVKINDVEVDKYLFQKDYYFVLNDNRDTKKDSRYYGFIPEDYIVGKVIF